MNCYHNSREALYRTPSGAQPCGTEITLRLRVEEERQPDKVLLRAWYGEEHFYDMLPSEDDARLYEVCVALPKTPCLFWYDFHVWSAGHFFWYGNAEDGLGGEGAPVWGSARSFQVTVYDPAFCVPEWTRGAVFYQIFPDRFRTDADARSRAGKRDMLAWDTPVPYRADPETGDFQALDFYGGSLRGVAEKLPYLESLGVTALYLNPCFEATSNHRYDTVDWKRIDPLLGDEADFSALCAEAEKRGIRILLDGVFSHAGAKNPDFLAARRSRDAKRFDWFLFNTWPDDYKCWWGFRNVPELNKNASGVREYFLSDSDSVTRRWLKAGSSGWRLDVADELPDDFIAEIRTAMEETAPDSFLLGEVWEDATTKVAYSQRRRYLLGHELHGVMNYPFRTALIAYLRGGDADDFRETLEALRENYPPEAFLSLMNFLGTHDTPRILTVLGADSVPDSKADRAAYRLSPAQRQIGLERLRLAALILFTFPGAPTVYYGDEAAMEGWEDPFNRAGYPWEQEDTDLKAHFAELARFRRSFPALQAGVLHWIWTSGPLLIFARELDGQLLTTVVNAADVSQALSLPWSAPPARDLLTSQRFIPTDNAIPLTLPPRSGLLLQTDLP